MPEAGRCTPDNCSALPNDMLLHGLLSLVPTCVPPDQCFVVLNHSRPWTCTARVGACNANCEEIPP